MNYIFYFGLITTVQTNIEKLICVKSTKEICMKNPILKIIILKGNVLHCNYVMKFTIRHNIKLSQLKIKDLLICIFLNLNDHYFI